MQELYVFFLSCSTLQLHDLIKYCFYLPSRVSFGLVANVLHCLLALLGRRHLILNAPDYVLRIFLKKMHVSALCICLIFTLNLGNLARTLEGYMHVD